MKNWRERRERYVGTVDGGERRIAQIKQNATGWLAMIRRKR
jgi:hypothetical protein